jgi:hypothetical protein
LVTMPAWPQLPHDGIPSLRTGTFATGMQCRDLARRDGSPHGGRRGGLILLHGLIQPFQQPDLDRRVDRPGSRKIRAVALDFGSGQRLFSFQVLLSGSRTTGPGGRFIVRMRTWIR